MEWSNKVCVSGPTSNDFLASDAISVGGEPCLLRMEGHRYRRLRDLNRRRRPGLCLPALAIVSLWVATSGKPKLWADQNQTNPQQQPPPQTQQGETKKPQEPRRQEPRAINRRRLQKIRNPRNRHQNRNQQTSRRPRPNFSSRRRKWRRLPRQRRLRLRNRELLLQSRSSRRRLRSSESSFAASDASLPLRCAPESSPTRVMFTTRMPWSATSWRSGTRAFSTTSASRSPTRRTAGRSLHSSYAKKSWSEASTTRV